VKQHIPNSIFIVIRQLF